MASDKTTDYVKDISLRRKKELVIVFLHGRRILFRG
jgi:hypothetical protein